nr:unnamed protein product [Haemonchus contortus]
MLYNRHSPVCRHVFLFGIRACVSTKHPFTHHSTVAATFLLFFHLILILIGVGILASHPGTLSDLVSRTNPRLVRSYLRQKRRAQRQRRRRLASQRRRRSASRSARSRASRRSRPSRRRRPSRRSRRRRTRRTSTAVERRTVPRSPSTSLDIRRLPDGTRFKTTNNRSFHMEYYVEDGVFVGSGTETTNKAISICAPIRPSANISSARRSYSRRSSRSQRSDLSESSESESRRLGPDIDNKNALVRQETRNV